MRGKLLTAAACGCAAAAPAAAAATASDATQHDPTVLTQDTAPDATALTQTVEGKLEAEAAHKLHAAVTTAARRRAAAAARRRAHAQTQAGGGGMPAMFQAIAQCESSGDPTARSGQYGGLFQFDQQTWASVGGSGDPASASPQEQLMRAEILYQQRGTSAWPVCGRGQ